MGVVDKGAKATVKGFNSLKKALKLSDDLPLERAAEAADPAVLNKVDELLAGQGIDPKSIGTYEDKIKTLITKPDAYAEYRKTLNEVYGKGDSRFSEAGFDTAQDGADTIIKLPGDKTFNVTSDKGDSLQMAQDLVYGRKPVMGGEPGKIAPTEEVAGAMERSLEQTDVGIPNKAGFNQAPPQKSMFDKTMSAISAPQRYVMNKAAGALGVKGDKEDSEKSAQNIVEGLAGRMGIPEDSTLGNAAKAGAVAGLEVFGDPLGLIPVGKAASMVGKAKKSAYPALKRMFSVGNTKFPASNAAEAMKVKDALVQSGKESSEAVIRDLERN